MGVTIPVYLRPKTQAPAHPAQAQTPAAAEPAESEAVWTLVVDKITQTALILVLLKLLAGWTTVYFWNIPMNSRWIWGFVPYVGLGATDVQYRTVAAWSSSAVTGFAVIWTLWHFWFRHRYHPARVWSAASALPMTALMALFEWMRLHSADHVLPTNWMLQILLMIAVATVLFLGFIENPLRSDSADEVSLVPQSAAQP